MSFKIHLIIVSFIIVAVYLTWQLTKGLPEAPTAVTQPAQTESPYSISITHASWGLNCRFRIHSGNGSANLDAFVSDSGQPQKKIREDNVLVAVSNLCNGRLQCEIPLTPEALGGDPMPDCKEKRLDVEYRCFSYDRPWNARADRGSVTINCDRDR